MSSLLVPHSPSSAGVARRRLVTELATRGVQGSALDDVALVVSELVGNAVRHGSALPDGNILITWSLGPDLLRLEVCDGGNGPRDVPADAGPRPAVPITAEGGRGLAIVATVSDSWGTSVRGGVTRVTVDLPIADHGEVYATA